MRENDEDLEKNEFQKELENSMREENDSLIGQILGNVKKMKYNANLMKENIILSNKQAEKMDKKYQESNNLINKTTKMLGELFSSNTNYWCYLCIFIFVVIFFLYKITH